MNALAPWRTALTRALHRNRSQAHSRYFQLATVTPTGYPTNRTVVFRGFQDNSDRLKIVTDIRSEKIQHLRHQPWGEICWYFTKTREQFRLGGRLILVDEGAMDSVLRCDRQHTWQQLSETAQLQFSWPPPQQARNKDPQAFAAPPPASETPPSNFVLLLLDPERVDHLELRGDPQNRWIYSLNRDRNWSMEEVNP